MMSEISGVFWIGERQAGAACSLIASNSALYLRA